MRKTFLVVLAIALVAPMAFAQEYAPEVTFEAEATATFGVNLDGSASKEDAMTGFSVGTDIDFDIAFIGESTEEFGEGEVYGYLMVEEFQFVIESDDDNRDNDSDTDTDGVLAVDTGEISAKVFLGPAYIVVATAGTDVNKAEIGLNVDESIAGAPAVVGDLETDDDFVTSVTADTGDNTAAVGFMVPDLTTIELAISSQGDWTENEYNNYRGAIYTDTTVAGFTIELDAVTALRAHIGDVNDSESAGDFGDGAHIGVGVSYELPLNEMMTLKPYAGADLLNDSDNDEFDIEIIAGANIEWGGDDLEVFAAASDETQAGVGVEVGFKTDESGDQDFLWVRLGFAEDEGDDGLLPIVGAAVLVEFLQATSDTAFDGTGLSFGVEVDADLGVVSPFAGLMYADVEDLTGNDAGLTMKLGTDIDVIPATTFTIAWNSSDLLNDADAATTQLDDTYAYEAAQGDSQGQLGTFTIATEVSY